MRKRYQRGRRAADLYLLDTIIWALRWQAVRARDPPAHSIALGDHKRGGQGLQGGAEVWRGGQL